MPVVRWKARLPKDTIAVPLHDGDTVWLELDLYFDYRGLKDIRMKDVRAPELKDFGGPETKAFAENWLKTHDNGSVWPYYVDTERNRADTTELRTFSRFIGTIYTADLKFCLNTDVQAFVTTNGYPGGIGS